MDSPQLEEIARSLAARPGHEKVRAELHRLLTDGLGRETRDVIFELHIGGSEVLAANAEARRGRIDALLGRTLFEIKSDLRREADDAERQLTRYLEDRREATGEDYVGVATDGATFQAFALKGGELHPLGPAFQTRPAEPFALPRWLESVVALREEIAPDIETVRQELGRDSVHYARAMDELAAIWAELQGDLQVRVKRDIWGRLLAQAYGADVESDDLFLQHTYLTIVAKAAATLAFFAPQPIADAAALLSGKMFSDAAIAGAVESDFFDWVLERPAGAALVMRLVRHVQRFRLREVEADILKGLYESLIDPATRHDLGEYYTPDWLAARICDAAIADPWAERVVDPACGSGTFLFHALRRLTLAGRARGEPAAAIAARAAQNVFGIDVHPVAVIFARATWLLALTEVLAEGRPARLSVPVYLGDSLQWNRREMMGLGDLEIVVPAGADPGREPRVQLSFPATLADDPAAFDAAIALMVDLAERGEPAAALDGWIARQAVNGGAAAMLRDTFAKLQGLAASGRNHIWGYVARNLSRPIWLASEGQKADVVVGNPPWVAYHRMSAATKKRFREEMVRTGLWGGLASVSGYDLSAYFFARAAQLYMKRTGRIGFVMPHAALTRKPYALFRKGELNLGRSDRLTVRFTDAWAFPARVQPLFPVPSCVMFAERAERRPPPPATMRTHEGRLPRRDASPAEADANLTAAEAPWPGEADEVSAYRGRFRQGATLVPRRFVFVERLPAGRLGPNPHAPQVRGRVTSQDKAPWKDVQPLEGPVEAAFLHTALLGESIAPFRIVRSFEAVIPIEDGRMLDSAAALRRGHLRLARWLEQAEALFAEHGTGARTFAELLDYIGQLTAQFPIASLRIVYAKAGTLPAAALVRDSMAVIDHLLYWTNVDTEIEGCYLTALLNSETVRQRAEQWQATGQFGARHFDKVAFNLPIPLFDARDPTHAELAEAGARAEGVAAGVAGLEEVKFRRARALIRDALERDGVAGRIEALVARLLDGA